jgi:hypothetical protein
MYYIKSKVWNSETVEVLKGKTMSSVANNGDEELVFTTTGGETWKLYHKQDCCESVSIEDITGELSDLVGAPFLMAEEISQENENPEGVEVRGEHESFTWTFYKFATIKGYVTVRWYGSSSGDYSESVDFRRVA